MKYLFLLILLFLVSCSGKDESNVSSGKVTSSDVLGEVAAKEYIQNSVQTLPPELKITTSDKTFLSSEIALTDEELQTLDQLQ